MKCIYFKIKLSGESIIACTSAKFVQLNASESGAVFGFGFRKEDDRKVFQNLIQVRTWLIADTSIS